MKKITIIFILMILLFTVFVLNVYGTDNGIMYKGTQSGSYVSSLAKSDSVNVESAKLLNAIGIASLVGIVLSFILAGVANKNGEKRKRTILVILGVILLLVIVLVVPMIKVIG